MDASNKYELIDRVGSEAVNKVRQEESVKQQQFLRRYPSTTHAPPLPLPMVGISHQPIGQWCGSVWVK